MSELDFKLKEELTNIDQLLSEEVLNEDIFDKAYSFFKKKILEVMAFERNNHIQGWGEVKRQLKVSLGKVNGEVKSDFKNKKIKFKLKVNYKFVDKIEDFLNSASRGKFENRKAVNEFYKKEGIAKEEVELTAQEAFERYKRSHDFEGKLYKRIENRSMAVFRTARKLRKEGKKESVKVLKEHYDRFIDAVSLSLRYLSQLFKDLKKVIKYVLS